jgi:GNAT superfamily N-acetyltransferase
MASHTDLSTDTSATSATCLVRPDVAAAPAPQTFCVFQRMADVPKRWRQRLRRLSLGSEEGAMVRWSYHDGSTWANVLFEGQRRDPAAIAGWAVFTLQEAEHPIIGVYVAPSRRGRGYGTRLVTGLLESCAHLVTTGKVYAVADWWPHYVPLLASFGFEHLEWD